ncbi:MAG TPA: RDD family protein [Candidatus Acidoferrales bacterium]|nr:RDD family protein [Candidatus Acidoferrales bacterium]
MKPCSLWIRSLAAVIDGSIVFIFWYVIIQTWGEPTAGGAQLTGLPALLLVLGVSASWIVPEWLAGATFGKWSCDLRVVSMKGTKISFVQSLKRNALRFVDLIGCYLVGFVSAKVTPNRQRLGDLWAKTLVVKCKDVEHRADAIVP